MDIQRIVWHTHILPSYKLQKLDTHDSFALCLRNLCWRHAITINIAITRNTTIRTYFAALPYNMRIYVIFISSLNNNFYVTITYALLTRTFKAYLLLYLLISLFRILRYLYTYLNKFCSICFISFFLLSSTLSFH